MRKHVVFVSHFLFFSHSVNESLYMEINVFLLLGRGSLAEDHHIYLGRSKYLVVFFTTKVIFGILKYLTPVIRTCILFIWSFPGLHKLFPHVMCTFDSNDKRVWVHKKASRTSSIRKNFNLAYWCIEIFFYFALVIFVILFSASFFFCVF